MGRRKLPFIQSNPSLMAKKLHMTISFRSKTRKFCASVGPRAAGNISIKKFLEITYVLPSMSPASQLQICYACPSLKQAMLFCRFSWFSNIVFVAFALILWFYFSQIFKRYEFWHINRKMRPTYTCHYNGLVFEV